MHVFDNRFARYGLYVHVLIFGLVCLASPQVVQFMHSVPDWVGLLAYYSAVIGSWQIVFWIASQIVDAFRFFTVKSPSNSNPEGF